MGTGSRVDIESQELRVQAPDIEAACSNIMSKRLVFPSKSSVEAIPFFTWTEQSQLSVGDGSEESGKEPGAGPLRLVFQA